MEQLPAGILTLANLSQQWASELIYDHEMAKSADFKNRAFDSLKLIFKSVDKDFEMLGQSNTAYKFDYRVPLSNNHFMLVDVINNHPNSISSAFKRNYDVKKTANDNFMQEGIIENQQRWKGEDINILSDVFDGIVPIESNLEVLRRYAANS